MKRIIDHYDFASSYANTLAENKRRMPENAHVMSCFIANRVKRLTALGLDPSNDLDWNLDIDTLSELERRQLSEQAFGHEFAERRASERHLAQEDFLTTIQMLSPKTKK